MPQPLAPHLSVPRVSAASSVLVKLYNTWLSEMHVAF